MTIFYYRKDKTDTDLYAIYAWGDPTIRSYALNNRCAWRALRKIYWFRLTCWYYRRIVWPIMRLPLLNRIF